MLTFIGLELNKLKILLTYAKKNRESKVSQLHSKVSQLHSKVCSIEQIIAIGLWRKQGLRLTKKH